uniref:Truncated aceohydroxyacid synthase small subunit n=1 Tax=Phaeophyceae sp. TaxID=2249243 RepID=A0A8E5FBD5_9PHAE|nr:truncated aceohydroxyacid synthase small subunit [Phaeophyceae sp.]
MKNMKTHILSIVTDKDPAGLLRLISIITRRRFRITSITVAGCEKRGYQRTIISMLNPDGDNNSIIQLMKQIRKLINVVTVNEILS